jgi:hypothetical protein
VKSSEAPYTKPGRLADVLALIQVLALDPHTRRREKGVTKDIAGCPASAESWFALANEHREFFRMDNESPFGLSLVSRYVLPEDATERRPQLSPEFVSMLMQTAINLHDRQVSESKEWKSYLPLWSALIGGVFATLSTLGTVFFTHLLSK